MKSKLIIKNTVSHFCKAMLQMFYFQDLCIEENRRISLVTSLTKKLVDDYSNKADDFAAIFEVAKILRRDIMNLRQWKFNGSFHDFKIPKSLTTLLELVLVKKATTKYNINNIS